MQRNPFHNHLQIIGERETNKMKNPPAAKAASQLPPLTFHSVTIIIATAGTSSDLYFHV
jgi:hypothetical protein